MSLLLDALKKAADEKQKAAGETSPAASSQSTMAGEQDDNEALELTLEEQPATPVTGTAGESISASELSAEDASDSSGQQNARAVQPKSPLTATPQEDGGQVSDEALALLVTKTNREYRRNKMLWLGLVMLLSFAVLLSGAVYFMQDMEAGIDALEQRHRYAMRNVHEKTSVDRLPEKNGIIRNLVSDAALNEKVEYARQQIKQKKAAVKKAGKKADKKEGARITKKVATVKQPAPKRAVAGALSIEKSQREDPVSVLLDDAWLAYDAGRYSEAESLYQRVLKKEGNNRDALLGLGAIALLNRADEKARQYYYRLLEINPDDAEAVAALVGLNRADEASLNEKELTALLARNPQSAPLNFAMGNVYAGQQKWKSAQGAYFNAWVNDRKNPVYLVNLAISLDQLGKTGEAKTFYEDALRYAGNGNAGFSIQAIKDRLQQINQGGSK